jgi:hypothetical protein
MNTLRLIALSLLALAGCQKSTDPASAVPAPAPAATPAPEATPRITATIQDLMKYEVDPAADSLWESVSTTVTAKGTDEKHPRTPEEWEAVRRQAIILAEAGNLLAMKGRPIAAPGKKLEDEGIQGILTAAEAQQKIDSDHAAFVGFAQALHDVGAKMLEAIDARNPQGMIDAGETLDEVCESCHMTFWYPNQVIPEFPD